MCLRPRAIDNPYLGLSHIGYNYLHDCTSLKMLVPCGHCAQCIAMKQSYIVQRSQMEALDNDLWFCTLTYKTSMLKYIDVNGYRLKYAYLPDFQNMIKRLRKNNAFGVPFRFWAVIEYGGKKHRPHYHVIFSTPKIHGETLSHKLQREQEYSRIVFNEWRRNVATTVDKYGRTVANTRAPIYKPLCILKKSYSHGKVRSTYDFHYINPNVVDGSGKIHTESDVAFYVTKYTVKANKYVDRLKSALRLNLEPEEFNDVWSLIRPRALVSKSWGDPLSEKVQKHIRAGIDKSLTDPDSLFPWFLNPSTGQTFPLSPFYKKRFFTLVDAHHFYFKQKEDYGTNDSFHVSEIYDPVTVRQQDQKFNRIKQIINQREEEDPFETFVPQYENEAYLDSESQAVSEMVDRYLDFVSCCNMLESVSNPDNRYTEYSDQGDPCTVFDSYYFDSDRPE